MTDRNLPPTATDDHDDSADARWFRTTIAPVVGAKPIADAWDEIRARATGEAPIVVRLDRTSGTGRAGTRRVGPRRRLALVAAAVIAVAGIGGAVVLNRDDGSDSETITATPPTADGTGWYIPEQLPQGWELESVQTDWMDIEGIYEACPCDTDVWASADGTRSVAVIASADPAFVADSLADSRVGDTDGETDTDYVAAIDVGPGAQARIDVHDRQVSILMESNGQAWILSSQTLDPGSMTNAARRVAEDAGELPVDGFELLYQSSDSPGTARAFHAVSVRLRNVERGVSLSYTLQPFDADRATIYVAGAVEELAPVSDERPLFVSRIHPRPELERGYNEIFVGGQWPGAGVMAGVGDSALSDGPATEDDVVTLLHSLEPATGDEWRTFLDTATGSVEDDARADRLSDLIVYEGGVVPGLDDDPSDKNGTSPGTPAVDIATDGPDAPNTRLIAVAKALVAGQRPFPLDDLFAPSVAIGLDSETIRTVGRANLSDPQAWLIDEVDVEHYAGYTPPFSALQLLADTGAFATVGGPTEGCAQPAPTPPPTSEDQRLVTITPGDIDSCIDWFAVTLVLDEQGLIAGVHLYLREP